MISYRSMAMKCMNCGKGVMYGHNVSHSKRRTNRKFKPNLQVARIDVGGRHVRLKLCTKCLRAMKRATKTPTIQKEVPVIAQA